MAIGVTAPVDTQWGYKVVGRLGETLWSAGCPNWDYRVRYTPGAWAGPPKGGGPLMVFATLDVARAWAASIRGPSIWGERFEIWRAQYRASPSTAVWVPWPHQPGRRMLVERRWWWPGAAVAAAVQLEEPICAWNPRTNRWEAAGQ